MLFLDLNIFVTLVLEQRSRVFRRAGRVDHCAIVGYPNGVMSPQNTHCDSLPTLGKIPRCRVWTVTRLVYPSAGGLHSSVDSDGDGDVLDLI